MRKNNTKKKKKKKKKNAFLKDGEHYISVPANNNTDWRRTDKIKEEDTKRSRTGLGIEVRERVCHEKLEKHLSSTKEKNYSSVLTEG